MPKRTLLLVFIHGFKGSDHTFDTFPADLRNALLDSLPSLDVLPIQYPQYSTRGDLKACVRSFTEWLREKVRDLESENGTGWQEDGEASVHVVLVGHSMGGIVAAEAVRGIVGENDLGGGLEGGGGMGYSNDTTNSTTGASVNVEHESRRATGLGLPERHERASSAPPDPEPEKSTSTMAIFPKIQAVLAFDTPFLGISPGVLAHGAEEQFNTASSAYKAFNASSNIFGWNSGSSTPKAMPDAKGLPAANGSGWGKWGKFAGIAVAAAGAAGAAYMSWDQINQGLNWAGSHLEFVGCLARGAELQQRVEKIVELERTHGVGFANFYGVLGQKTTEKTKYAGAVVGEERTFCVVPKQTSQPESPTGTKRRTPSSSTSTQAHKKRRKGVSVREDEQMAESEKVQEYAEDASKSKGTWVRCLNKKAGDELRAHTSMFSVKKNSGYGVMVEGAAQSIVGWVDSEWAEGAGVDEGQASAGAEREDEEVIEEDEMLV